MNMMKYSNIQRKPITRLAFVLCIPMLWAATCQTPTVAPTSTVAVEAESTPNEAAEHVVTPKDSVDVPVGIRAYSKDELLGRFEPNKHPDFVLIQKKHTGKDGIYLQRGAYEAFQRMYDAAKAAGLNISIISATRNFNYQKGIWEKKWLREKYKGMSDRDKVADIMKFSSMPGTSRHHWGTDVDFNSVELAYWQSGSGAKIYKWLVENAPTYGFHQTYTNKSAGRSGYEEEKWHWSYMPIAREMHRQFKSNIAYADITGFSGCKEAEGLNVFATYVDGIAPELLPK
ncbi:MAG: hypothetical protein RLZZ262_594 [Bacteroidota bacterium]|jgi:zinc D-Ala-D-Ala carboxypeptidase